MKKLGLAALALMIVTTVAFKGGEMLSIGSKAPLTDVKMKNVTGSEMSLKDAKMDNGLLVIFSCNTCPFVLGWEDTYPELGKLAKENKIGMVLINSNEGKRSKEDSFDAMKQHYEKAGYNTPYLVDENHKLADAFGGKTTPHVYLFNSKMELVYRGAINDKYENKEEEVTKTYLKDAIGQLVKGEKIATPTTQERGCSIKRVKA